MKTKEGFRLRAIGTDHVLTPDGLVDFNRMIAMNSSAAFLWEKVEGTEFDAATLAGLLVAEYGIDQERAMQDSIKIAKDWIDAGIAQE